MKYVLLLVLLSGCQERSSYWYKWCTQSELSTGWSYGKNGGPVVTTVCIHHDSVWIADDNESAQIAKMNHSLRIRSHRQLHRQEQP